MIYSVLLWKEAEDIRHVIYRFSHDEVAIGRLKLDKITGEIEEIEQVPIKEHYDMFLRARAKVYSNWKAGEIPDLTQWAL